MGEWKSAASYLFKPAVPMAERTEKQTFEYRHHPEDRVFALHNWETGSKYHVVTVNPDKKRDWRKAIEKKFTKWKDAEKYAQRMAKKLHLRGYKVDTPDRPHVIVKLKEII
jgi:hypothetical protein